jgi:hypothetical protein
VGRGGWWRLGRGWRGQEGRPVCRVAEAVCVVVGVAVGVGTVVAIGVVGLGLDMVVAQCKMVALFVDSGKC